MLVARQISAPPWAGPFNDKVSSDVGKAALLEFIHHRTYILTVFHQQIQDFFDDPDQTMDEDFPRRSELTGDYYVGDWRFSQSDEYYIATIEFRCLGYFDTPMQSNTELDYLGLEGIVYLHKLTGQLEIYDSFNTSVI